MGMIELCRLLEQVKRNSTEFDIALGIFLKGAQKRIDDYLKKMGYDWSEVLSVDVGKRYVRVVKTDSSGGRRSAFCFVDKENGDVLKTASWKVPAKHARGNIFDSDNGLKWISAHGAAYLR